MNENPSIISSDQNKTNTIELAKNRIFMNHVDQYNARHMAEYLTDQMMGAVQQAVGMRGEEGEDESVPITPTAEVMHPTTSDKYECIGTMKFRFGLQSEDIAYTVSEADDKVLQREILSCGFVIYDISADPNEIPKALKALEMIEREIEKVEAIGPKTFQRYDRQFFFVLISTILTWGKTKPIDRDDPDVPFTEADYRKRRALPNYAEHIACERQVVALGKKYKHCLKTYVLCCGIPYGFEEDTLSVYFKMAWENKDLPIFLPGNNIIPLIHVQDLAKVVHLVIEFQPKKQYILVVEQTPCRLSKIVRALAKSMGRGVKEIVKEEAFLCNNIKQSLYDMLTINLKMEPAIILDELGLEYRSDLNLVQNMNRIVAEFREARNLNPMRVLLHGPIASGRTSVCMSIVDYYGLHYVNVRTMIDETRQELREQIEAALEANRQKAEAGAASTKDEDEDEGGEGEGEEEDADAGPDLADLQEQLATIETTLENNDGMLPDDYVIRLMRQFLAKNICQNQGYVLDAYPKTIEQCKELFGAEMGDWPGGGAGGGADEGMDEEEPGASTGGRSITPTYIISLQATDDYLTEIMMSLPEKLIQGTLYEEENMLRRLKQFHENNTEDNTLLNFFDEHEIHPNTINVMTMHQNQVALFEKVRELLGPIIGFEQSIEERERLLRCREEAEELLAEQAGIEQQLLEHHALKDYEQKMEERIAILNELQKEEEKLLTVQCEPLRNYLMTYVFPTLTQGLLEVARIKPDDPVDYLAEYLFKYNPEGKMFDPTYTRRGELIQTETKDIFIKKSKIKKLEQECGK